MESTFAALVIVVSLVAFAVAVIALATSGGAYERIGRGALSVEERPAPDREVEEVRQFLEARNARRGARGEPPLDVEDELLKRLHEG